MNSTSDADRAPSSIPSPPSSEAEQVTRARGKFAAIVATYSLSVMNDQFFKETTMLLVLQLAMSKAWQGYIQLTFMLPFVLLAAPVGWLADRFPKRSVIIGSRLIELLAALIGAFGLWIGNWTILLIAIGIMGFRGAVFSPSINGSIPELYPVAHVTKANGILKVFTTAFMLAGIACAGFALDLHRVFVPGVQMGRAVVAGGIILLALIGILVSYFLPRRPAASPGAKFPYSGPLETLSSFNRLRKDPLLLTIICSNAYFWFLGALLVQLINALGITQLHYTSSRTSYLVVAEVVGVAIGGVLCSRLATGPRWYRVLAPAGMGMGVFLLLIAFVPALASSFHLIALLLALAIAGIAGGLFMVPQESFIQVRPSAQEKGSVISSANFASFTGMLLAGPASIILIKYFIPSIAMAIAGGLTLLVALWLRLVLPRGTDHA